MEKKQIADNAATILTKQTKMTEEKLAKEPKVSFIIPLADGEKPGASEIVNINGYQLNIKKVRWWKFLSLLPVSLPTIIG